MTHADKAHHFHTLHQGDTPLVLYNIWDVATAKTAAAEGAGAIATGSWSVAAAQGYEDGQNLPFDRVIQLARDLVLQTDLPVSIDFECGYADDLDTLAQNFETLVTTGIVGVNFEDQIIGSAELQPLEVQCARLKLMSDVATQMAVPVFMNARTDIFLKATHSDTHKDWVEAAITRGQAYAAAGASGFFVPGLTQLDLIAEICKAVPLPVNVMAAGAGADIDTLTAMGVQRISFGPKPFQQLMSQFADNLRAVYR